MKRFQWFFALCVAVFASSGLAQNATIVLSTNNTPIDRRALEILTEEVGRRTGLEFKIVSHPSERSLHMANQGEVDGEGLRVAGLSNQYSNLMQVPERFIGTSFVAFSKGSAVKLDQGWESLQPYRVAFITGWKMFEANASGARTVTKVESPEQMFKMLDGGRVDLALYTRADGIALVRNMGLTSIVPLTPSLKDVDMYLYLHKRHESLVGRIAQALRDMKADGSHKKLLATLVAD